MDEHLYGGGGNVDVDSCESCNVLWVDRGELSRIVAAPDRDPQDCRQLYGDSPDADDNAQENSGGIWPSLLPKKATNWNTPK